MIKAFRLEDTVLQLTSRNLTKSTAESQPIWIALSNGSQCIAGLNPESITKHLDLSALLLFYDMDNIDNYILQRPWIKDMIDER